MPNQWRLVSPLRTWWSHTAVCIQWRLCRRASRNQIIINNSISSRINESIIKSVNQLTNKPSIDVIKIQVCCIKENANVDSITL